MKKIEIGDTVINGLPLQQHQEMKDYDEFSIETKEQVEEMKKVQKVRKVINLYEKEGQEYIILSDGKDIETMTRAKFEGSNLIKMAIDSLDIMKTCFHIADYEEIVLWEFKINTEGNAYKDFCFGTTIGYEGLQDGAYALLGFNLPGYQHLESNGSKIMGYENYEIDFTRYIYHPEKQEEQKEANEDDTIEAKQGVHQRKPGKFQNKLSGIFKS